MQTPNDLNDDLNALSDPQLGTLATPALLAQPPRPVIAGVATRFERSHIASGPWAGLDTEPARTHLADY